jgi:hypothetical protein
VIQSFILDHNQESEIHFTGYQWRANSGIKIMNRLETGFSKAKEAQLRYLDADFKVIKQGDFVRCAVTGQPIPIEDLLYWSVENQEAYASAEFAFQKQRGRP